VSDDEASDDGDPCDVALDDRCGGSYDDDSVT